MYVPTQVFEPKENTGEGPEIIYRDLGKACEAPQPV
jgi:hypothetical protein